MASFRIFERCGQIGAAQSSKKVALDAFAAQLTRLRQQLRDGSEAVVLQTFHELDGLTVGMYVYGYFLICMCVCVCVCVYMMVVEKREEEKQRGAGEGGRQ